MDEGILNLSVLMVGRLDSFKVGNGSQLGSNLNPAYWLLFKGTDPSSPPIQFSFNYYQLSKVCPLNVPGDNSSHGQRRLILQRAWLLSAQLIALI